MTSHGNCPRCGADANYGLGEHYCTPKVNKKSKFNQQFDEPILFQENSEWVISAELYTKKEAYKLFKEELDSWGQHEDGRPRWREFTVEDIKENRVRFGCFGFEDRYDNKKVPFVGWFLEQNGKGSKPVWVLQIYQTPKKAIEI